MPKLSPLDYLRLAPALIRLVDAIRLAARDERLTAEELQSIGEALVAVVAAIPRKGA